MILGDDRFSCLNFFFLTLPFKDQWQILKGVGRGSVLLNSVDLCIESHLDDKKLQGGNISYLRVMRSLLFLEALLDEYLNVTFFKI